MSVDWVITVEQTKRVTLCVALSSGNQLWGMEKEALARLGHLAPLKVKETYSIPLAPFSLPLPLPPPLPLPIFYPLPPLRFISFFSFRKELLENVESGASVLFVSSFCVWLGIPQHLSPQLSLHSPSSLAHPGPVQGIMLEAGERGMTRERAVWLASDLGLVLPSLLSSG